MSQVLELAKQGDTAALSALMNRHLKAQGVTAQIDQNASGLKIRLEGLDTPDQRRMSAMLTQGIQQLGLEANVQILGFQMGAMTPAWSASYAISENGITSIELPDPAQVASGNLSPEDCKRMAKQGNLEALQKFVEGALADKPKLTPYVEFADGVVKVTVETAEFMDGQAFAADFGKAMNEVASKQVRELEIYKRKSEKTMPFLVKKMTLAASGSVAAAPVEQPRSRAELRPNGHSSAMRAPAPVTGPVGKTNKVRPGEVTTVAFMLFVGAAFNLIVGGLAIKAVLSMASEIAQATQEAGVSISANDTGAAVGIGGFVLFIAALPMILGILQIVVGIGVLKMKRWAWFGALFLCGLNIVLNVLSLLTLNVRAFLQISLNLTLIRFLYQTGTLFE
jgi:hypothetical protein